MVHEPYLSLAHPTLIDKSEGSPVRPRDGETFPRRGSPAENRTGVDAARACRSEEETVKLIVQN